VTGGDIWLPLYMDSPAAEDLLGENRGEGRPAPEGAWLEDSTSLGLRPTNRGEAWLAESATLGLRAVNLGDALLAESATLGLLPTLEPLPTAGLLANLGEALLAESATLGLRANLGDAFLVELAAEERLGDTWLAESATLGLRANLGDAFLVELAAEERLLVASLRRVRTVPSRDS